MDPDTPHQPDGSDQQDASGSLEEQRARRLADVEALRARGVDPYPAAFRRDRTLGRIREEFEHLEPGAETDEHVTVAGRLMLLRNQGKLIFAQLQDRSDTLQLFVSKKDADPGAWEVFERFDRGDWVGVTGVVMSTRKGELSVKVRTAQLLSKCLRPLPEKHHGLADQETRYRQRYVDLATNPEARRIFDIRFAVVASIRRQLHERGYLEVETPVLNVQAGGASARPFVTHYHALGADAYLRIALELHLKRLIVGGLERVFEIGRIFRNEGLDTRHNPEFTMLESYEAFADYVDMMDLTEALVTGAARDALGTTVVDVEGRDVDLARPWRRVSMIDLVREHCGVDMHPSMGLEEARRIAADLGVDIEDRHGVGQIIGEVYDQRVERHLIEPTFVTDHPRDISPLAKAHRDDPTLVERFEAVVGCRELANAYSELNDPIDQRARFEGEARAKAAGDLEAGDVDEDYLRALEFGLPPTGGLGIGIDRLVMLLAAQSTIREVILFPTLRPEVGLGAEDLSGPPPT